MSRNVDFAFLSSKSDIGCLPVPVTRRACTTAAAKLYKYLRKLFNFNQMDFEFASWQMMYLFINPQKVYRNFQYRNETKSQFARDDPAFLVLLCILLLLSSIAFALLRKLGFSAVYKLFAYFIFVDCIGIGIIIATFLWFITNKYMIKSNWRGYNVEWAYAFDVHLNAFTPTVVLSHICLLIIRTIYSHNSYKRKFLPTFLSNTICFIAATLYLYITYLGYKYVPFVRVAEIRLLPVLLFVFLYLISLIIGVNMNNIIIPYYEDLVCVGYFC